MPHITSAASRASSSEGVRTIPRSLPPLFLGSDTVFLVVADHDSRVFGDSKPTPVFNHHELEQLGVPPEAAFHVGDAYDDDVEGARAAGIRPILLDPLACEPRECETRITSLPELLTLLDRAD